MLGITYTVNSLASFCQTVIIIDIGSGRYRVSFQSVANVFYDVSFGSDGWRYTCQHHPHGKRLCKHILVACNIATLLTLRVFSSNQTHC